MKIGVQYADRLVGLLTYAALALTIETSGVTNHKANGIYSQKD